MSRRAGFGRLLKRLVLIAIVLLIAAAVGLYVMLVKEYKGFQDEVLIEIPKHTGTRAIADQLAKEGVIQNSWEFLVARAVHPRARLQAGEYRFTKPASVWTVFDRIARGDIVYYDLVVPEGSLTYNALVCP